MNRIAYSFRSPATSGRIALAACLMYSATSHGQGSPIETPAAAPVVASFTSTASNPCHDANPARVENGVSAWVAPDQILASQEQVRAEKLAAFLSDVAASWKTFGDTARQGCAPELELALEKLRARQTFNAAPERLRAAALTLKAALDVDPAREADSLKRVRHALRMAEGQAPSGQGPDICHDSNPARLVDGASIWKPLDRITPAEAAQRARQVANYLANSGTRWASLEEAARGACAEELTLALDRVSEPYSAGAAPTQLRAAAMILRDAVKKATDEGGADRAALVNAANILIKRTDVALTIIAKDVDRARYGVYGGVAYTLTPEGSWNSGIDVLARFSSTNDRQGRVCGKGFCNGFFEIGYFSRGGEEPPEEAPPTPGDGNGTGTGDDMAMAPAAMEPAEPDFVNPFESDEGVFAVQMGYSAYTFRDWIGFGVRAGAETLPTEVSSTSFSQTKPFAAIGFAGQRTYYDGALGDVFIGYAHDERWRKDVTGEDQDATQRLLISGLLQLPGLDDGLNYRIAGRLHVSVPLEGGDSSEVRLSVLLAYDPAKWLNSFVGP